MVRTGNVDFSCKRLTSIEIRKSKYHIIRRVRFRWDPPPPPLRKISGFALDCYQLVSSTSNKGSLMTMVTDLIEIQKLKMTNKLYRSFLKQNTILSICIVLRRSCSLKI